MSEPMPLELSDEEKNNVKKNYPLRQMTLEEFFQHVRSMTLQTV
jgi:hypothetical protein